MALFPDRHPLLRQPSHVARINERHWLARDLVFAHSGHQAFVAGRPSASDNSGLVPQVLKPGAANPALNGTYGWSADGTNTQTFLLGFDVSVPLTLSYWLHAVGSAINQQTWSVRRASGFAGGFAMRQSNSEACSAVHGNSSGGAGTATGPTTWTTDTWRHDVGVFRSATSRYAYANGVAGTEETTSITTPSGVNRVVIGGSFTNPMTVAGSHITAIALPIVIARTLDAAEIARLHEEQRSNPWSLFTERRIWVPVSAAGGGAFKAAWAARPQRTIGAGVI